MGVVGRAASPTSIGVGVLLVLGLASCSRSGPATVQLQYSGGPDQPVPFLIHREWTSDPADSGNGNQVHEIEVGVTFGKIHDDVAEIRAQVAKFTGKDLTGKATKHLATIAPEVEKLRLRRRFAKSGPLRPWDLVGYTNSGWAGAMARSAIGVDQVGFLELHFPNDPVSVGSTWTAPIQVSEDSGSEQDAGPLCTYRLESLDPSGKTATVTFYLASSSTTQDPQPPDGKPVTVARSREESGTWVIDLATGIPASFAAKRKSTITANGRTETEWTRTEVMRQQTQSE